jgi:hypothetical protein
MCASTDVEDRAMLPISERTTTCMHVDPSSWNLKVSTFSSHNVLPMDLETGTLPVPILVFK